MDVIKNPSFADLFEMPTSFSLDKSIGRLSKHQPFLCKSPLLAGCQLCDTSRCFAGQIYLCPSGGPLIKISETVFFNCFSFRCPGTRGQAGRMVLGNPGHGALRELSKCRSHREARMTGTFPVAVLARLIFSCRLPLLSLKSGFLMIISIYFHLCGLS